MQLQILLPEYRYQVPKAHVFLRPREVCAIFGILTPMIGMGTINDNTLNIIYNLADFINKILFGLIIWRVAVKESQQ